MDAFRKQYLDIKEPMKLNNLNIEDIVEVNEKVNTKVKAEITFKNEKHIRALIKKNLNKEIHPGTKPSVDLIYKILEDAYNSGMHYDVSDMENAIFTFASRSTNHSDYCTRLVMKMKFKSEEPSEAVNNDDKPIIFYDVEVFPNLFVVVWKAKGEGNKKVRMINPKPWEIDLLDSTADDMIIICCTDACLDTIMNSFTNFLSQS